ncbi:MAG: hypothetical protein WCG66_03865 [bacterium]|jgi:hypothetical protein
MKITNKFGLPDPVFRALSHDGYMAGTKKADISVTTLIGPPKINQLKKRYSELTSKKGTSKRASAPKTLATSGHLSQTEFGFCDPSSASFRILMEELINK